MKVRSTTFAICAFCAALFISRLYADDRPASQTALGRFQLFQGYYTVSSGGTAFKENAVFKLDTVTGEVWVYFEGMDKNGKFFKRWLPTETERATNQ